jgi:prolipoprotein diacylglyceryltransferase
MLPVVQVGPLAVQLPGLVLLAGVWAAVTLAEKRAAQLGGNANTVSGLIFAALVAGVIGARLGHAARHPAAYAADPGALLALTPATLSLEAGLAAGLVAAIVEGQRRRLEFRPTLDALAPALAALAAGSNLANFLSGDAFGTPTTLPWAIPLWGAQRHPVQLYELAAALATLAVLWWGPWHASGRGLNFLAGAALLAAGRVIFEAFRGDSLIWAGGWRAAQLGALALLGAALWLMRRWAGETGAAQGPLSQPGLRTH